MKCPQCGAVIEENIQSFCPVCGEKLGVDDITEPGETEQDAEDQREPPESQMVAPLNSSRKRWRTISIIAGAVLLVAVVTIGINLAGRMTKRRTVKIEGVRQEYYQQALDMLDDYCDSDKYTKKALNMGGPAFDDFIKKGIEEFKGFIEEGSTKEEKYLANTVAIVSLFSLSNNYEAAYVEQSGGRADEQANALLARRIEAVAEFAQRVRDATNIEELEAIGTEADELAQQ